MVSSGIRIAGGGELALERVAGVDDDGVLLQLGKGFA